MIRKIIVGISYVLVVLMLYIGLTSGNYQDRVGTELSYIVFVLSMGLSACVLLLSLLVLQPKE